MERKKKKTFLVIIWTITLVVVVGACLLRFSGIFGGKAELEVVDFDGQEVSSVSLNVDMGDVEIKYGPIFQVEYRYPKKYAPKVEVNNGMLSINQTMNGWTGNGIFGDNQNYEMTITIPKGTELSDLDIVLDLGEIELEGLEANTLTINDDLGSIKVHNVQGTKADITASLGEVELSNCVYPTVIVKADLGDVNLDGDFDSIDAHVDLGDLDIKTVKSTDDVKIKASCELGDIEVNGEDW